MLAREYLRERTDDYRDALKKRGANVDLDRFITLDSERRRATHCTRQHEARRRWEEFKKAYDAEKEARDAAAARATGETASGERPTPE